MRRRLFSTNYRSASVPVIDLGPLNCLRAGEAPPVADEAPAAKRAKVEEEVEAPAVKRPKVEKTLAEHVSTAKAASAAPAPSKAATSGATTPATGPVKPAANPAAKKPAANAFAMMMKKETPMQAPE